VTENDAPGNDGWATPGANGPPFPPTPSTPVTPGNASQQPSLTYRSWQPGIVALRPLPFGDFITVPFKAMRFNRPVIVGGPLLMYAVSAVLTGLALWVALNDNQLNIMSDFDSLQGISVSTVIAGAVALLSWVISDVLASSVVFPAVARALLGERITLTEGLRTIAPRIGHLLLFSVITYIPLVVVGGLGLAAVLAATSNGDGNVGGTVLGIVAIVLLLIIPIGGVIAVYSVPAKGAIIIERASALRAIRRAIALVPGRFWWTALIMVVVGVIVGAVQQAFGFVSQIAAFVPSAIAPESTVALAIGFFVAYLFQLIVACLTQYSFFGSANALIYLDMRMRKEGLAFDLAKAAEARHATSQSYMA